MRQRDAARSPSTRAPTVTGMNVGGTGPHWPLPVTAKNVPMGKTIRVQQDK